MTSFIHHLCQLCHLPHALPIVADGQVLLLWQVWSPTASLEEGFACVGEKRDAWGYFLLEHTVHGCEILHQLIDALPHYL